MWLDHLQAMLPDIELSIRDNQMDGLTEKTLLAKWSHGAVEYQIRPESIERLGDRQYAEMMYTRITHAMMD